MNINLTSVELLEEKLKHYSLENGYISEHASHNLNSCSDCYSGGGCKSTCQGMCKSRCKGCSGILR